MQWLTVLSQIHRSILMCVDYFLSCIVICLTHERHILLPLTFSLVTQIIQIAQSNTYLNVLIILYHSLLSAFLVRHIVTLNIWPYNTNISNCERRPGRLAHYSLLQGPESRDSYIYLASPVFTLSSRIKIDEIDTYNM